MPNRKRTQKGASDSKASNALLVGLGVGTVVAVSGISVAGTASAISAMNRQSNEVIASARTAVAQQQAEDAAVRNPADDTDVNAIQAEQSATMQDIINWMSADGISFNSEGYPVNSAGEIVDNPFTDVYEPAAMQTDISEAVLTGDEALTDTAAENNAGYGTAGDRNDTVVTGTVTGIMAPDVAGTEAGIPDSGTNLTSGISAPDVTEAEITVPETVSQGSGVGAPVIEASGLVSDVSGLTVVTPDDGVPDGDVTEDVVTDDVTNVLTDVPESQSVHASAPEQTEATRIADVLSVTDGLEYDVDGNPYYVVKKGDCLSRICEKYGYSDYNAVAKNNGIRNPDLIYPDDVIYFN